MKNNLLTTLTIISILLLGSCSEDDEPMGPIVVTVDGATVSPNVGGPNMPNQVFFDLSTNIATEVNRTSWDLGFSSMQDRVIINGSILMMAARLSTNDMTAVNSTNPEVQQLQPQAEVGNFNPANMEFIDAPDGNISGTAIDAVSSVDSNNNVYLINLGYEVGVDQPNSGSSNYKGDARGWKKIRILKDGENYLLQYANLDDTTFQTTTINKNPSFHYTFFSFNTESVVSVEPQKEEWDLCYTVFTNEAVFGGQSYGAYAYADFITNNIKSSARAYMIDEAEEGITYEDFSLLDVVDSNFENDQRSIGSTWRNGGGPSASPSLIEDVFYVIHDANGNYYKLQFLALTSPSNERGYPQFAYKLLEE